MTKKKQQSIIKIDCSKCCHSLVQNDETHCVLKIKDGKPTESSRVVEVCDCTWYIDKEFLCRR